MAETDAVTTAIEATVHQRDILNLNTTFVCKPSEEVHTRWNWYLASVVVVIVVDACYLSHFARCVVRCYFNETCGGVSRTWFQRPARKSPQLKCRLSHSLRGEGQSQMKNGTKVQDYPFATAAAASAQRRYWMTI